MTVRSSDPSRRHHRSILRNERGAVLAFVVLALFVLLACAGLAIDLGRGYITKLRLSRAVDAAALAGARAFRIDEADTEAKAVFRANIPAPPPPANPVVPTVTPGTNARGEDTLAVSASQTLPTVFMRVVGIDTMNVGASAVAAVPPLDLVLVLDTSISLTMAPHTDAFEKLQIAAVDFVDHFHDRIDRMGLVAFASGAGVAFPLGHDFKAEITHLIRDVLVSKGNTHMQEGLRLARLQITNPSPPREEALKVVVFFTDGIPTSTRGFYGGEDRTLVAHQVEFEPPNGPNLAGHYDHDDIDAIVPPCLPPAWPTCVDTPLPKCPNQTTNGCYGYNALEVRELARLNAQAEGTAIRAEDVLIYVIGLGNVQIPYLCQMANSTGQEDDCEDPEPVPGQPNGKMFHAPTPDELDDLFNEVARDLLVRLAS